MAGVWSKKSAGGLIFENLVFTTMQGRVFRPARRRFAAPTGLDGGFGGGKLAHRAAATADEVVLSRGNMPLRRFAMVVSQHAAEPFAAGDLAVLFAHVVFRHDELVVEPLVISLLVIMLDELRDCVTQ